MVVVGVGLNSQVGTIMGLLGAADDAGSKAKAKSKNNNNSEKKKSKSKSSTKVSPSSSNETNSRVRRLPPLSQSIDDGQEMQAIERTSKADGQETKATSSRPTTAESIEPQVTGTEKKKSVAADDDSAPADASNDSKHKCK